MDTAVALVQAYLRVNGYFTVAEYPAHAKRQHKHSGRAPHPRRHIRFDGRRERFARDHIHLARNVADYLMEHLREHWDLVRHVQTKDPVLGLLLTLEKARRGSQ